MNGDAALVAQLPALTEAALAAGAPCVAIAVPHTLISMAATAAPGLPIGAQDVHHAPSGAFTGSVSAEMIRAAGGRFTILGHSERRIGNGRAWRDAERQNGGGGERGVGRRDVLRRAGHDRGGCRRRSLRLRPAAAIAERAWRRHGADRCVRAVLGDRYRRPAERGSGDRGAFGAAHTRCTADTATGVVRSRCSTAARSCRPTSRRWPDRRWSTASWSAGAASTSMRCWPSSKRRATSIRADSGLSDVRDCRCPSRTDSVRPNHAPPHCRREAWSGGNNGGR